MKKKKKKTVPQIHGIIQRYRNRYEDLSTTDNSREAWSILYRKVQN